LKINVAVILKQDTDGRKTPLSIIWTDGRTFDIDRILDVRRAASLKSGGVGERYTCRVRNKQIYLFNEEGSWFLEAL
jgi:hypothetical protein